MTPVVEVPSPFEQMVPPGMVVVEVGTGDDLDPLLPGEVRPGSVPGGRRRWELQAGRHCAAQALGRAGVTRRPVVADGAGAPVWPVGWTGSITHSGGRCAAGVAPRSVVAAMGIDMERPRPISGRAVRRVCTSEELAGCEALPPIGVAWPLVVFSAKESFYKAWWPRHRRRLAFDDIQVELTVGAAAGTGAGAGAGAIRFRFTRPPGVLGSPEVVAFRGRLRVDAGWVRTVVWVPAPAAA